jgi:hypothetical protein
VIEASGTVNMKQTQSLEINKRSVIGRKAGCGCVGRLPHIFCHPAARPTGEYTKIGGTSLVYTGGYVNIGKFRIAVVGLKSTII